MDNGKENRNYIIRRFRGLEEIVKRPLLRQLPQLAAPPFCTVLVPCSLCSFVLAPRGN